MKEKLSSSDLSEVEANIQQLLLDTSDYIGTLEGHDKPELRFAGGWVRDKLLGSQSDDIDVCIDNMTGTPFAELLKEFVTSKYGHESKITGSIGEIKKNPDKSKHLETATMRVYGLHLDFVNLRKEIYENSRTPTMTFGTAEEDALRRDSTINSLFYNLSSSSVEDFTQRGLDDLEHKIIKTPLAPLETFRDDPLRVLRHIRFASRLGFTIASEDEQAMSDASIQEALKLKISRERIGVEIEKMLKGPDPFMALSLIENLGLYNTIFTNPNDANLGYANDPHNRSGHKLSSLAPAKYFSRFKDILVRNDDRYLAWLLFALVPWGKAPLDDTKVSRRKIPPTAAAAVAKEGLKAPTKVVDVVEGASRRIREVQSLIAGAASSTCSEESHNDQTHDQASLRLVYGKAIRQWKPHWRLHVLYAFFVQMFESDSADWQRIFGSYQAWLSRVESLRLLDIDSLEPLADGRKLKEALGAGEGKWLKSALEMVIDWQLRNPNESDPAKAIAEVEARKHELDMPS